MVDTSGGEEIEVGIAGGCPYVEQTEDQVKEMIVRARSIRDLLHDDSEGLRYSTEAMTRRRRSLVL